MKRTRAKGPKVRTGCVTCKIRHVKCDEAKPACGQCTRTGRTCDGYPEPAPRQKKEKNPPAVLATAFPGIANDCRLILVPGTRLERESVDRFCRHLSARMAGHISSPFWDYLLPQLSGRESSIRHAMAAVSAAHRRREESPASRSESADEQFILEQYNKAIQHLMFPVKKRSSTLCVLVTCCLFVILEALLGHTQRAVDHVQAGLTILDSQSRQENQQENQQAAPDEYTRVIHDELAPLFARLNIQLSFFGRELSPFTHMRTQQPDRSFANLHDAQLALDRITGAVFRLVHVARAQGVLPDVFQQQQLLTTELLTWSLVFDRLTASDETSTSTAVSIMRMHHRALLIWLASATFMSPLDFDAYIPDFQYIVRLAESVHQGTGTDRKPFTLEMGVVVVLYLTACKCRHSRTRRKAADLLLASETREAMWEPRQVGRIAEMVILEEEGINPDGEDLFVPLHRRIQEVYLLDTHLSNPTSVILAYISGGEWKLVNRLVEW
ncbi:hypothetical protein ASPZODRAFT_16020 [Penicilliopsis zonata CBS 506.65]|uniref:Zn(2)-C6 fungal-type domain-containing protein n=1 Tax=Penicilliopsis zonata CBS 506.65 TaxID=1073090 RepID=A0A1L9SJE2_9EURO|nr:hypothetical protein ASPZODRAFT_16020 [Penicilliopsis zonata CBS 506.65]OJJ47340.1 hypothetical protein ASPZODRAFT_16020 [Penicilliopsis zonata CBS 506.65]